MRRIAPALTLLLGLAGCESITGSGADTVAGLEVHGASGKLVMRNTTDRPVHYVAISQQGGVVVDLHPDPTVWPSLRRGATLTIPYAELAGGRSGVRRAVVHAWNSRDGFEHAEVWLR